MACASPRGEIFGRRADTIRPQSLLWTWYAFDIETTLRKPYPTDVTDEERAGVIPTSR